MSKTTKPQAIEPDADQPVAPKRKVGRPPKTDKKLKTEVHKRGVKSEAAQVSRKGGASTREMIVASASEIINRTGVIDFRIEALAQSLALSPGNITYHFPKKEDIIAAIWQEYITQLADNNTKLITPLLDIKQLFLYFRTIATKTVNYVGVATYYFGDMGAVQRNYDFFHNELSATRALMLESYDVLRSNGYMNPIKDKGLKELTFQSQYVMLNWWLNHALTKYPREQIVDRMDRYIAMSLLPLAPYLTPLGKQQLDSILNFIK